MTKRLTSSIGAEKSSDKTAFSHYKNSQQNKNSSEFLLFDKKYSKTYLMMNREFPLKSGARAGALLIIVLEVQASCTQTEKKARRLTKAKQHFQYLYAMFCD